MPKILLLLIIAAVVAGLGYWIYQLSTGLGEEPSVFEEPAPEGSSFPDESGEEEEGEEEEQEEPQILKETVLIQDFLFLPQRITVKKGTEITWQNNDSAPHTATAQGVFDSGILSKGETFSYQFNQVGIFNYICTLHPLMKGEVVVEE